MAQTSGKHILIVDDYGDSLDVWELYLRALGYQVSTASDGAEALTQAQRLRPGVDVARQLRGNPDTRSIPLIAATGYSHARQLARAREAGFNHIVVKPCDPNVLVEEIERLLKMSSGVHGQPINRTMDQGHNNR